MFSVPFCLWCLPDGLSPGHYWLSPRFRCVLLLCLQVPSVIMILRHLVFMYSVVRCVLFLFWFWLSLCSRISTSSNQLVRALTKAFLSLGVILYIKKSLLNRKRDQMVDHWIVSHNGLTLTGLILQLFKFNISFTNEKPDEMGRNNHNESSDPH